MSDASPVPSGPAPSRRGLKFVLSSPSGAGKSSLSRYLLTHEPDLVMSVSMTTRPPRPGETDGVQYHFLDEARFLGMQEEGAFLEWALVHGHRYGTPRGPVLDALAAGRDVLFDIDYQGAQQLAASNPADLVRVFILPPSWGELERRLRTRAQDSDAVIARRLAKACEEVGHWQDYDYVLVNDDFALCSTQVRASLTAERLRRARQPAMAELVAQLLGGTTPTG